MKLTLDHRTIDVPPASTLLQACELAGIQIPTLCYLKSLPPNTSCMVCVVEEMRTHRLIPACTAPAEPDMIIETENERVLAARTRALDLLLSEHVGDCQAPCQRLCPLGLDIPRMLRDLQQGDVNAARSRIQQSLPLPHTLAVSCQAPCEKGCRRGKHDASVAIRTMVAWTLSASGSWPVLARVPRERAVVFHGLTPQSLAAAHQLRIAHQRVMILETQSDLATSMLDAFPDLESHVVALQQDASWLENLGVEFAFQFDEESHLPLLDSEIALWVGELHEETNESVTRRMVHLDMPDFGQPKSLVKALQQGREWAAELMRHLGMPPTPTYAFNVSMGRLGQEEMARFVAQASSSSRTQTAPAELSESEVWEEAARCLHCDCRAMPCCRLRDLCEAYKASTKRLARGPRQAFQQSGQDGSIIYEKGKCIRCGLCLSAARQHHAPLGLTWLGRGHDMEVGTPLGASWEEALGDAAQATIDTCPTGALAWK